MILAIETATPRGSVALLSGDEVRADAALPPGRQASETILSAVAGLLRYAGAGGGAVRYVAVSAGPGAFTGLRVGMAAAKGFCFGWRIPIVPVPTLHAMVWRFPVEGVTVCPVLDARKREIYAALFRKDGSIVRRLSADMAIAPERLPGMLPDGPVLFCGDGAGSFAPFFRERLGVRAVFPQGGEGQPSAAAVGRLAADLVSAGVAADAGMAVPAYIRPFI